jgi:hypothetical protein
MLNFYNTPSIPSGIGGLYNRAPMSGQTMQNMQQPQGNMFQAIQNPYSSGIGSLPVPYGPNQRFYGRPVGMAGGGMTPYKGVADQLSSMGRYGDSMLVHMNPEEVRGLASLSPTGQLTTNPETGQPEAFLPLLAPLIGSWLGGSAATALGSSALLGSALGSGLATWAATGDLKQGILSGITGYGLGSAFGAAGGEAAKEAAKATTQTAAESAAKTAIEAIPESAFTGSTQKIAEMGAQTSAEAAASNAASSAFEPGSMAEAISKSLPPSGAPLPPVNVPTVPQSVVSSIPVASEAIAPTAGQYFKAPFTQPGAFMSKLASREMILPYLAESQNAEMRAQEELDKMDSLSARNRRAELNRSRQQISDALAASRYSYPRMADGGITTIGNFFPISIPSQYTTPVSPIDPAYSVGLPPGIDTSKMGKRARKRYEKERAQQTKSFLANPAPTQGSLRGSISVAPPQVSYDALHVGGQGYMPGISPQFSYFRDRTPGMTDEEVAAMQAAPGATGMQVSDQFLGQGFLNRQSAPQKSAFSSLVESYAGPDIAGGPSRSERLSAYLAQGNPQPKPAPVTGMAEGGITDVVAQPGSPEQMMMEEMASSVMPEEGMSERDMMSREYDNLIRMTAKAILGMVEDPEIVIEQFISEYGQEAFNNLRKEVLNSAVPGAQTDGMISGPGGGMDDMVPGMIGATQPVAVSPGEYIVPADVVSGLGDGSSEEGGRRLDNLLKKVRMDRTGTSRQPPPVSKAYMGGLV